MINIADPLYFIFGDYARAISAGVIALSIASVVFRLLWEFR